MVLIIVFKNTENTIFVFSKNYSYLIFYVFSVFSEQKKDENQICFSCFPYSSCF